MKRRKVSEDSGDFLSSREAECSTRSTREVEAAAARGGEPIQAVTALYDRYLADLDDLASLDSLAVKRSFDKYMQVVNGHFNDKLEDGSTAHLKLVFRRFNDNMEELERRFCAPLDRRPQQAAQQLVAANQQMLVPAPIRAPRSAFEALLIQEDLAFDFLHFYRVLARLWMGERSRKSEVAELQPSKVLIMRSLVKRKFGEELDLR